MAARFEGAYKLATMCEKAAPAIPFLIASFKNYDGVTEVDESPLTIVAALFALNHIRASRVSLAIKQLAVMPSQKG